MAWVGVGRWVCDDEAASGGCGSKTRGGFWRRGGGEGEEEKGRFGGILTEVKLGPGSTWGVDWAWVTCCLFGPKMD